MRMSIEQKIKTLLELYHFIKGDTHFCGYIEEDVTNALETAIDTMRKYHKIEEIVQSKTTRVSYDIGFRQIKKVVEDGNDNR